MNHRIIGPALALALGTLGVREAQAQLFQPPQQFLTDLQTVGVAVGDVNSDGLRDVVVTGCGCGFGIASKVYVYLGQAGGSLNPVPVVYIPQNSPGSVSIGDVTGDGRPDVVMHAGFGMEVMAQNAAGGLEPSVFHPSNYSEALRIGDLNGDGRIDSIGLETSSDGHTNTEEAGIWYQNASGSFDPQAMSMMLDVMQRHGLEVPGPMTVLSRALLTLEGTLRTIDPTFNIAHEATALLPELADQQSDMLQEQLQKEVVRALPSLRTLPGHVEAIAVQLRRGSLSMRVERFAGADREVVDEWVDRIVFAAMGLLGMIASGVLLVAAALVQTDDDFATALQVIGFFGVVVTAVIQMRVVAQILRRGDAEGRRRV